MWTGSSASLQAPSVGLAPRAVLTRQSLPAHTQVLLGLSVGTEAVVMYQFHSASRPVYSSTGALVDGGMDLNQPGGLTEYA